MSSVLRTSTVLKFSSNKLIVLSGSSDGRKCHLSHTRVPNQMLKFHGLWLILSAVPDGLLCTLDQNFYLKCHISCCCSVAKLCWTLCDPMDHTCTRFLHPPLFPGICSNSCALSQWCYLTIASSATPFSFGLQSFSASGSFPMSLLFISVPRWSTTVLGIQPQRKPPIYSPRSPNSPWSPGKPQGAEGLRQLSPHPVLGEAPPQLHPVPGGPSPLRQSDFTAPWIHP